MVKEWKLKAVETLKEELEKSPVIGILDVHKMPSKQLQEIRKKLRGKAKIRIVKKVILKFAMDGVKRKKLKDVESFLPTQPGIVLSDMEAFKLFSTINGLRFKTFAKEGDVAKEEIWAYAGPTSLMAGPAISEFQQAGVPASIESGKIAIRKDSCVVKKGEVVSALKADVLRKLKIEPMEILLNVVAVYQNGDIIKSDALELVLVYPKMLPEAFNNALSLSVYIAYPTKENIGRLLAKASQAAMAVERVAGTNVKNVEGETKGQETSGKKEVDKTSETPSENGGAK